MAHPGWFRAVADAVSSRSARALLATAALLTVAPCLAQTTQRVPASAFHSDRAASGMVFDAGGYVYGVENPTLGTTGCLVAPVDLPVGGVVTAVRAHLLNNSPFDFGVRLYRKRLGNSAGAEEMARVTTNVTTSQALVFSDLSIASPTVDELYAYYLATDTCPDGSSQRIYAVDIEFEEPPLFADGFESGNTTAWSGGSRGAGGGRGALESLRVTGMHFLPHMQAFRTWHTDVQEGYFTMEMDSHSVPNLVLCMAIAPVLLPDDASVEGMVAYVWDTSTQHQALVRLSKSSFTTTGDPQVVLSAGTSVANAPPQWQVVSDLSAEFGSVSNGSSWFFLEFCQGESMVGVAEDAIRVQAVDILYSMP